MNKDKMMELIDIENGKGFSKNVKFGNYNFSKNDSFISFKISKVDNIQVVSIQYIYSNSEKDFISLIAYCCNFWMGMNVKFIYYKEKEKFPYVVEYLREIGFKIEYRENKKWPHNFECIKNENPCSCRIVELYV